MKTFKRILSYGRPYGRYWPPYLLLSLLSVIFGIVNYALLGPLLTVLFEHDTYTMVVAPPSFSLSAGWIKEYFSWLLSDIISSSGVMKALVLVCILIVISCFLCDLFRYISQRILVNMKTRLMKNIRRDLYSRISTLDIGYFSNKRKGDILSSLSNDVAEVQNSIAGTFHIIFREPILVIGFLAMLFYMSPRLTAVSLVALPLSAVAVTKLTRRLRSGSIETQDLMGRIVSQFEEAISGLRIIKAFNAQNYVNGTFEKFNERHRKVSRSVMNRQELAHPTSEFLGISIAAVILLYGGWLNINGNLGMSWSEFIVYIMFYWKVLEPAKAIANSYASLQKGLVSGDRIFAIIDAKAAIKESDNPVELKEFKESIEFEDVSFSYGGEPVLEHISFSIPKGKTVAIVGPSGAGKSTVADLLARFWDVSSGVITIDGHNIKDYSTHDLLSLAGIVTQETILFNDTVFNNIAFGMEGVSEDDVYRAARVANADVFIRAMEDGYQTNINDRGQRLSGGQRQRIAIARAVLKNPPLLILDEATSALDTESEKTVQEALSKLMSNRTSLVIAHRLSTIRNADEIIVLQGGRIVERGTHETLINNKGLYSHLCELQAFS